MLWETFLFSRYHTPSAYLCWLAADSKCLQLARFCQLAFFSSLKEILKCNKIKTTGCLQIWQNEIPWVFQLFQNLWVVLSRQCENPMYCMLAVISASFLQEAVHTGTTVAAQSYRLVLLCVSDCITKKMACDIKNFPEYFSNSLSFPEIINSLRFPGFP